jgi:hypothetical protein
VLEINNPHLAMRGLKSWKMELRLEIQVKNVSAMVETRNIDVDGWIHIRKECQKLAIENLRKNLIS